MTTQRNLNNKLWCLGKLILFLVFFTYFEYKITQLQEDNVHLENTIARLKSESYKPPDISHSEDLVVIYNRVPKTGSTSFVNVAYDLCKRNHFKVLHINVTGNSHFLSLQNQMKFVHNVSQWDEMKPALYHGHMAFVDFSQMGARKTPVYINIIRKPLDRLVSYYYFLRFGDTFRPHLVRRKHGDKMSFDDCVQQNLPDCSPENMWLQIPFFCGHAAECWQSGSTWALEQAKRNLIQHYLLVGVTEEMEDFIRLLEVTLPRIFKGATEHYITSDKSHLRVTSQKGTVSKETVAKIERSIEWKLENEFYEFVLEQFRYIQKRSMQDNNLESNQIFFYEKIRPK